MHGDISDDQPPFFKFIGNLLHQSILFQILLIFLLLLWLFVIIIVIVIITIIVAVK